MTEQRRNFVKNVGISGLGLWTAPGLISAMMAEGCKKAETDFFPFYRFVEKYDVGDFIPKDQGGKFVQMEIFGTESDTEIVKRIRAGRLNEIYGQPMHWDKLEAEELEKSVWLNRFYFLPSFARLYYLQKDKNLVADMFGFIEQWIHDNPYDKENSPHTYNWRDMQAAWRAIHWSWCFFLTKDALSTEQRDLLLDSLKLHADILLSGFGEQPLNEFNHQSHGALAMLYLGSLFPDWAQSDKLRNKAWIILEHHLNHAFFEDGGNVEMMFGYYPFETHIFRDALIFAQHNNEQVPAQLLPMLGKMAFYLDVVACPDRRMPPINDSYPMKVDPILETLGTIEGVNIPTSDQAFHFFRDSQLGVLKKRRQNSSWYVLCYPAKIIGAHAHAGRLSFTLWRNGRPLIVDSGCCNYDDPLLVEWFRTSKAHNTVMIDGTGDPETSTSKLWVGKRSTENRILEWMEGEDFSFCQMFSPSSEDVNLSVDWYRNLVLLNEELLIVHDFFSTDKEHSYHTLFHFPTTTVEQDGGEISVGEKGSQVRIMVEPEVQNVQITEGWLSVEGKPEPAPVANLIRKGKGDVHQVHIIADENQREDILQIDKKQYKSGIALRLHLKSGEWLVLIKNPGSDQFKAGGKQTEKPIEVWKL